MVYFNLTALKQILDEVDRMLPRETGGLIMGNKLRGRLYISEIVGPGPKAIHHRKHFIPDDLFHEKEMARIYNENRGEISYLGDWHSHPGSSAYLSEKDKSTLKGIAGYKPSRLPQPLMLIIGLSPFELRVWQYVEKRMFGASRFLELKLMSC